MRLFVVMNHDGLVKSDFVVELDKNIWNLKKSLLQIEVSIVGMHGLGKQVWHWPLQNYR